MWRRAFIAGIFTSISVASALAADPLPRKFGALSLGMAAADFAKLTGVDPGGRCADCLPQQNGGDVEPELVKPVLDSFSTLARFQKETDALPTIFFYKGKLEFILLTFERYHFTTIQAEFERILGAQFKRETFPKRCIYSGGESITWSNATTLIILTEYRDATRNQLEVKFADRALMEEAEKLQDLEQKENIKKLEREGNC